MNHYLVFREEGLSDLQVNHRYEHNERTAEYYNNQNIDLALSGDNYYLKKPEDSYENIFQKKLQSGEISIKGLKKDAAHYSEILIAVNRDYWIDKSEEFRIGFFKAAYEHLKEKFGEENILSAVIHADEIAEGKINYHLHVVAIPIVEKKRYFSKRSKDKAGQLKCIERQVSHSKLFQSDKDEMHKKIIYSYSKWQDEILNAVKEAGYTDIHRGNANQKAVHLHPAAYKNLMERIEAEADGLLEDIKIKPYDQNNYLVNRDSFDKILDCKSSIEKQKAVFDMATQALMREQDKVFERQNKVYQIEQEQSSFREMTEEVTALKDKVKKLLKENQYLKELSNWLQEKMYQINQCFGKISLLWMELRNNQEADSEDIVFHIDEEVKKGINILTTKNIQADNLQTAEIR